MTDILEFKIIDAIAKKKEWALDYINDKIKISAVEIYINGKEIIDIFKEIETPFAKKENNPNLAGAYGHKQVDELLHDLTESDYCKNYGVVFVVCSDCGIDGCWGVSAFVSEDDKYVYFKNFKHNHRKDWIYPISYQFTKENYYSELQKLKDYLK